MPATEPLDKPGTAASRTSGQVPFDDVAWEFLGSEFTGVIYADWPLDRRLDVFLRHYGYRTLLDDGSAYGALLERVMENISVAVRTGVLPPVNGGDGA